MPNGNHMNVLIDLDGTITDSRKGIVGCIQHALRSLGHDAPDESSLLRYIGPPLHAAFRELLPVKNESDIERAIAAYRERYVDVGMFENSVYEGIPEALETLRDRGARLFVATSKPEIFAQRILDHFELSRHFEKIYGSELDGRRTDKIDLITHVLSQAQLDRSRTIMIGDRHHDVVGAIANRIRALGALWGYGSREELSDAGAETLLESPSDVARLEFEKARIQS
jgi:phosphoglycolate phosphatase